MDEFKIFYTTLNSNVMEIWNNQCQTKSHAQINHSYKPEHQENNVENKVDPGRDLWLPDDSPEF